MLYAHAVCALALCELVPSHKFVAALVCFVELLSALNVMSLVFQQVYVSWRSVVAIVRATKEAIRVGCNLGKSNMSLGLAAWRDLMSSATDSSNCAKAACSHQRGSGICKKEA